jgi:hypothetical protein
MRPGSQRRTSRSVHLKQTVPLSRRLLCWIPDHRPLRSRRPGKGRVSQHQRRRIPGRQHHLLVAEDLAAGRLVRVLPDYALRSTEAYLVYPSVRHMRPAVRAFTDFAVPRIRAVEGIGPTA